MNANSTQSGRYATPRHVKAIDPGAFYAVDSWALARSDSFSAHSCVLSRRGAEGRKLGPGPQRNRLRNRYGPRSTNEEAYNNLQPTYTYPQPLASKAAPVPGSKFNRQGGSKFNRRGQLSQKSAGGGYGSAAASRSRTLSDCSQAGAASQTVRRPRPTASGRIGLQAAVQILQATGSPRPLPVSRGAAPNARFTLQSRRASPSARSRSRPITPGDCKVFRQPAGKISHRRAPAAPGREQPFEMPL